MKPVEIVLGALQGKKPSENFFRLKQEGILVQILPELCALEVINNSDGSSFERHKDNFKHTLQVLDNVAEESDEISLRFVALFHDLGKAKVKKYHPKRGWTFDDHQYVSVGLAKNIFKRWNYNENIDLILNIIELHHHPLNLYKTEVTDSALRRLKKICFSLENLLFFCEKDVTTKSEEKASRYKKNLENLRERFVQLEISDRIANYEPPIKGKEIMERFNLPASPFIGEIKGALKSAILSGEIKESESLVFVTNFINNNKHVKQI